MNKPRFSRWVYWGTVIFLFLPLLVLTFYSFNEAKSFTWQGFSLRWYLGLFAQWMSPESLQSFFIGVEPRELQQIVLRSQAIWGAVGNSVVIALGSASIATVIGTLAAIGLNWYEFPGKKYIQSVSFIPLLLPEIIIGVSLLIFFRSVLHMELGMGSILLAHTSFVLPFVIMIIMARLGEFDFSIIEAARDLGAKETDVLWKVIIPITMPGILSGFLTAVTLSLEDFVVTLFVQGSNSVTLPLFIFSAVKRGVPPEINALSVIIIVLTVILMFSVRNLLKYIVKSK